MLISEFSSYLESEIKNSNDKYWSPIVDRSKNEADYILNIHRDTLWRVLLSQEETLSCIEGMLHQKVANYSKILFHFILRAESTVRHFVIVPIIDSGQPLSGPKLILANDIKRLTGKIGSITFIGDIEESVFQLAAKLEPFIILTVNSSKDMPPPYGFTLVFCFEGTSLLCRDGNAKL